MKLLSYWTCLIPTLTGLGWAGGRDAERLPAGSAPDTAAPQSDAMRRSGLVKTDAEDLLDWLEAHGCRHFEISSLSGDSFAVRWWN